MSEHNRDKDAGWDDHVAGWAITIDGVIHGYFDVPTPDEQNLIQTASGLQSLSPSPPSCSTYIKTIKTLWSRLDNDKRSVLVKILVELGTSGIKIIKAVLATLFDAQFDVLVDVLNCASLPRFRTYLDLLALPKISVPQLSEEGLPNECPNDPAETVGFSRPEPVLRRMIRSIHDLPPEIFDMIEKECFQQALAPGHVFPDQMTNGDGLFLFEHKKYEPLNVEAFLALGQPASLATYQQAYWTENIWVIGLGHPHDTIKFLDRMDDLSMRIKKVHISFSVDDVCGGSYFLQDSITSIQAQNEDVEHANLQGLARFASECDSITTELLVIWRWKFSAICWLDLTNLILDLRDAYDPSDVYLARPYWLETLSRFQHGLPTNFTILARTPELVTEAREAITAIN